MEEFIEVKDSGGGTRPLIVPRGITHLDDTSETVESVGSLIGSAEDRPVLSGTDKFALAVSNILRSISWDSLQNNIAGAFVKLLGSTGGQTIIGGTDATGKLTLQATSASGTTRTDNAIYLKTGDAGAVTAMRVTQQGIVAFGSGTTTGTSAVSIGITGGLSTDPWAALSLTPVIAESAGTYTYSTVMALNSQATIPVSRTSQIGAVEVVHGKVIYDSSNAGTETIVGTKGSITLNNTQSGGKKAVVNALWGRVELSASSKAGSVWGTEGTVYINRYTTADYIIGVGALVRAPSQFAEASGTVIGAMYGLCVGAPPESFFPPKNASVTNISIVKIGGFGGATTTNYAVDCIATLPSYFAGSIGIGNAAPTAKLDVVATTEQLRLGYDATYYASFTVNSAGALKISSPISWMPAVSATPASNGELTIEFTSNTQVTIKGKGSDGVVRSVALTLS